LLKQRGYLLKEAKHGVKPEIYHHNEKQSRPQIANWHQLHGHWKHNKHQLSAVYLYRRNVDMHSVRQVPHILKHHHSREEATDTHCKGQPERLSQNIPTSLTIRPLKHQLPHPQRTLKQILNRCVYPNLHREKSAPIPICIYQIQKSFDTPRQKQTPYYQNY